MFSILLPLLVTLNLHASSTPAELDDQRPQRPAQEGWVMFDDSVALALGLPGDQLQRLRDMDGSYQKEYMSLGNDPAQNPRYGPLTDRRNADIRLLLTPEQYGRWVELYDPASLPKTDER